MSILVQARTQVVSFLFIDLVAFSKESTASQHKIKTILIKHLTAALAPIPASEYRLRDTGDGAYVAFWSTPELALYTALALARACNSVAGTTPLPLQRLRVGLHMGTVKEVPDVEGRTNYLGDGINAAKRIQDLAEPGQMLASRSFFDAFAHLDADYSSLFSLAGSGDDKHGRSYELFALRFEETAFDKLSQEISHNFNEVLALTVTKQQGVGGELTQVSDFIKKWFIPVNALLFSVTFYVGNIGKIANQARAVHYTGLSLLVLSVFMGLVSWWLSSLRGSRSSAKNPGWATVFSHKPVIFLSFGLGLVLTGGAWFIDGPPQPLRETKIEIPVKTAPVVTEKRFNAPSPALVASAPTPPPANSSAVAIIKDTPPVAPKVVALPHATKNGKLAAKANGSNPRCTSLLQKASSGEPFSPQEQNEMVSTCQ